MSTPKRFLTRMALFLVAVLVAVGLLFPALQVACLAAPILNGMILAVLLVGIVYIVRQVLMLGPEAAWIASYRRGGARTPVQRQPRGVCEALGEQGIAHLARPARNQQRHGHRAPGVQRRAGADRARVTGGKGQGKCKKNDQPCERLAQLREKDNHDTSPESRIRTLHFPGPYGLRQIK